MNYLLDTCVLLWMVMEKSQLSEKAKSILADPRAGCHVSSITAFEIGQKNAKAKLDLPLPPEDWFPLSMELHNIVSIPLDHRIALKAASLPTLHSDPFDRLLIATAMEHQLTLITPDQHIRQYPGIATLW